MFSLFFFFSSRRRHTRFDCDWSSDVCSSDLSSSMVAGLDMLNATRRPKPTGLTCTDAQKTNSEAHRHAQMVGAESFFDAQMRSEERRVGKSVDLGGRRIIKKKK